MNAGHVVIIPHFNDSARLGRCLDALRTQDRTGVDVVVVDNGSTEPLDKVKAANPDVRFVVEPGKGAALARNRGVAESRAEAIIFLDADCVPAPGWLAAACRAAGRADIVGGAIDVFDETPPPRSGAEAFETVFAFNYKDYIERKGFSVTANLVTTRKVFEAVGPFTNGLSEDAEWCFRARDKGYRLALDESMRVAHPTRSDWPALVRKWRRIAREMFALHGQAHPGPKGRLLWAARALAMAGSWLPHLPRLLFSSRLDGAGERLRGAATLIRLRLLRSWWMLRQVAGSAI
ncbi:MAG: glycosyltransferase [Albidovulum sp.]|uniref:glycosyltransferase family 2 protein n=1 Tax=Albidovulum sp. TaxID=1872424 RepID=UPI001321F385|nr:glycosyltransferase [Defluviimonas sp.]KAB2886814.1 MAG: glycosyltransferase [Defluviimonas sp.]